MSAAYEYKASRTLDARAQQDDIAIPVISGGVHVHQERLTACFDLRTGEHWRRGEDGDWERLQ